MELFLDYCVEGASIYDAGDLADEQMELNINNKNLTKEEKEEMLAKVRLLHNRHYGSQRAEYNAQSTILALCQ